jgi:hypothetical protein
MVLLLKQVHLQKDVAAVVVEWCQLIEALSGNKAG